MFFEEKMKEYLEEKRNKNTDHPYRNHVEKFVKYLVLIKKASAPLTVTSQDISDSVGYCVKNKSIRTESTMSLHLEVIKDFYQFLHDKGYIQNIFLQDIMNDYDSYKNALSSIYQLKTKKEIEFFDREEVLAIFQEIEMLLSKFKIETYGSLKVSCKKRYVACIFIKLSFLAPAKKSVIFNLKCEDFSKDLSSVVINNIKTKITNSLRRDIQYVLNEIPNNTSSFFKKLCPGISESSLNSDFLTILKQSEYDFGISDEQETYSVQKIVDTAIKTLVESGANPAVIATIAGIGISAIEKKFYNGKILIDSVDDTFNSNISNCFYHSYI